MKAILISIKPKWVADILNRKKTIEIRKTMPKCDLPIDVYIYCTKDKSDKETLVAMHKRYGFMKNYEPYGRVVAKFTLNKVEEITQVIRVRDNKIMLYRGLPKGINNKPLMDKSCLSFEEMEDYLGYENGYALHISNLVIFDKPKELGEFKVRRNDCPFPCSICNVTYCQLKKAPQSWQFIESEELL